MRVLQGGIPLLDAVEHAIKLIEQEPDFIVTALGGTDGIILASGYRRRRLSEFADRARDHLLQA